MSKSEKLLFAGAPKGIRKMLTDLHKAQVTRPFMMTGMVPRPDMLKLCDGTTVKYTGP